MEETGTTQVPKIIKKKSQIEDKYITIRMTKKDYERLVKVIRNEQSNRDRAFEGWRKKNNVDPNRKPRSNPIQYEIIESDS
jgi:phosphorylcholine metabolism protein LicD